MWSSEAEASGNSDSFLIVATVSFGDYFNANNVGESDISFPLLFGICSVTREWVSRSSMLLEPEI
jgi:hypothetical protein